MSQSVTLAVFLGYFAVLALLGWTGYRRTVTPSDYLLGGRSLGRWRAALSAGASDMSGWLLLGLPGYAYLAGLESVWLALGLLIGSWLNWRLLAAPLRRATVVHNDALTIPAFLNARFGGNRSAMQRCAALLILLFFVIYAASGLVAAARLFETAFGLGYHTALLLGVAAVVFYTAFGGFHAVVWTDVLQALLMLFALVLVPVLIVLRLSHGEASATFVYDPRFLDPRTTAQGEPLSWVSLTSLLAWGLGYFGQPHILARFKALGGVEEATPARRIALAWTALTLTGAVLVGIGGAALVEPPLSGAASETIFMELLRLLLHPVLAAICLAAILAAVMSTADSQLLVCASAATVDLPTRPVRGLRAGRLVVIGVALLALVIAWNPERRVLGLVAYAWAGFGAAFGPALLLTLHWSGMRYSGAAAAMVTGAATVVIWHHLKGGLFDMYELVPGFLFALAAAGVGSYLERRLSGMR